MTPRHRLLLLLALGLPAGCVGNPLTDDPIHKPGTWEPTYDNDANLRAMVADPRDLAVGESAVGALGSEAAPPVGLLFAGKRQPLPDVSSLSAGPPTSSGSGSGAAPQGGGSAGSQ